MIWPPGVDEIPFPQQELFIKRRTVMFFNQWNGSVEPQRKIQGSRRIEAVPEREKRLTVNTQQRCRGHGGKECWIGIH